MTNHLRLPITAFTVYRQSWVCTGLLIGLAAMALLAAEDEQDATGETKAAMAQLPAPVAAAIRHLLEQVPTAHLHEIETRHTTNGSLRYVAEFESPEREGRLECAGDGQILHATGLCNIAPDIPIDQWPAAVRDAAERLAKKNPLSAAKRIDQDGKNHYQTSFIKDNLVHTLIIAPDGTIVSMSSKALER